MTYNKINHYRRIIKMQEIVKREKFGNGLSYKEIYYRFVEHQFNISLRTYQNWLGVPAVHELKKLKQRIGTDYESKD